MEQSMSRSMDYGNTGNRNLLITGKSAKIDILFPMFDQMVQLTKIPTVISTILAIFYFIQTIITSYWPEADAWFDGYHNPKVLSIFTSIFWFIDAPPSHNGFLASFIVNLAFLIITFCWIFGQIFFYEKNLRFSTWGLYITRFILECLMPIFTFSSSVAFGASVYNYIQNRIFGNLIYAIISFIIFVCDCILYYLTNSTLSHTSCITVTAMSAFGLKIPMFYMLVNSVANITSYVFYGFPIYTILVFIAFHIFSLLYIYYLVYTILPFHNRITNTFHASLILTNAASDIFTFFDFLFIKSEMMYGLIFPYCFFSISLVINIFLFRYKYKYITEQLFCSETSNLSTEREYEEYFVGLGLGRNEQKALMYLHVGFTEMCPYFLNWSLTKFITNHYDSTNTVCMIIQIISFFPSEFRQLNHLFSAITSRTDMPFHFRFLIYQVYRIKTLRQSSSSSDANDRLTKLRSLTEQCMSIIASFWRSYEPNAAFFELLSKEEHRINSLWLEAVRDFPNSSKLFDEYATFLIECLTDFHMAVIMKRRSEMIENGFSFAVDQSFRSLIWSYPNYMKRGILYHKGNIADMSIWKSKSSGSFSSEINTTVSEMIESESTIEFEEKYGKQILTRAKLRLAADSALKKRTHISFEIIPIWSCIAFIVGFSIYMALFFYIKDAYYTRRNSVYHTYYLSRTHFHLILGSFMIFVKYVKDNDLFDITTIDKSQVEEDGYKQFFLTLWDNPDVSSLTHIKQARYYFRDFYKQISDLITNSNDDIYPLVERLIGTSVTLTQCRNNTIIHPILASLKNVFAYTFFLISSLTMEQNKGDIYHSDIYCESQMNLLILSKTIDEVYEDFVEYVVEDGLKLIKMTKILQILCPLLLFIFSFLPYFISAIGFVFHVNRIASILLSFDRDVKEQAIEPIRKDSTININAVSETHVGVTDKVFISFILFLFSLFSALLCYGLLDYTAVNSHEIDLLNIWSNYSAVRLSSSATVLYELFQGIVLKNDSMCKFINRNSSHRLAYDALEKLREANRVLLRGTDDIPSFTSFDPRIDEINSIEQCTLESPVKSFHETYMCGSADKLLAVSVDLVLNALANPEIYNGEIKSEDLIELLHLMNSHLWIRYQNTGLRLTEIAVDSYEYLMKYATFFLLVGIVSSIITFTGGFILKSSAADSYKSLLSQIKRIPPQFIVQDKRLKNFLLSKDEEQSLMSSVSRSILHNSTDAMLCVSLDGVVEMVNPAVTDTLGFTPEQVLGQPIVTLFPDDDADIVINQMNLILEGQNGTVYEDHLHCATDNSELLPVHMTLLGMQHDEGFTTKSFVMILRNESDLLKRQKDAEEAKTKSENLLYHILPQDVVMKLNRGEKDICFTVPEATIVFIDVVRFSEYAKILTPQDIMGCLTQLFSGFDYLINRYNLMLKIKLIGDVYMAAGGLFTDGQNVAEHANQTVKFSLDALNSIDDVNVKLNSNLQVRIGVNTGGPIIAGVLGTDKPVFDIIGDTINVASRLQSTDIPGKIQIPQSTYDLLNKNEYCIEQRGEVFLKGKGQVMTYLISPEIAIPRILV
ncbi:Adenylate and Guanylate cyclase catalytic domain containing protein [Tritrichomonas foetus]|uniref:Adenylate and Guanylate cyclase catalytic domain containing protein n=1 Tax=Tritrichomonas foetus TaxID=1144522 RepID=A0A1J4KML5_9EUKA|nr:Adenylate and Guanylate cyclase catalytic domain containing protein [Tritrichomonas foetus]|eukprot:OHT12545.1 Adenylate and Guanylate cyclase catalytic domain containing protein [Tritrichomonas foetus]